MGAVTAAAVRVPGGPVDADGIASGRIGSMAQDHTPGESDEDDRDVQTARSLAMLLGVADLVGRGWEIVEERTWPTGELDSESDKSRRAHAAGGITAWRSLAEAGSTRTAWFEVVPYATSGDAELSLRQVPRYFVGTSRPDQTVVSERVVDDEVLPGYTDTWIFEKLTTGPGGDDLSRYVGGTVDRILFLTSFGGPDGVWSWGDVMALTERQAERVRLALGIS